MSSLPDRMNSPRWPRKGRNWLLIVAVVLNLIGWGIFAWVVLSYEPTHVLNLELRLNDTTPPYKGKI